MTNPKKIQRIGWILLMCSAIGIVGGSVRDSFLPKSEGILYHIEKDQNSMYLLGSIHVGSADMARFGENITKAMNQADTFVFECDTTHPETAEMMNAKMALPKGETLADHITPTTYEMLTQVAKQKKLSMKDLDAKKPWAVANVLAVYTTADALGTSHIHEAIAYGVENQVMSQMAHREVDYRYLETAQTQIGTLEQFSPALQDYLISSACMQILHPDQNLSVSDAGMEDWATWWMAGDADAFSSAYRQSMQTVENKALLMEYQQALLTQRHEQMAKQLSAMLAQEGEHHYFVTIGLLHLVLEENSVLTLLEEAGYTVTRIAPSQ